MVAPPPPHKMQSLLNRMSTIPVQPSYHTSDIDLPEPPQTEAGRWTFHSQKEFPSPPPFEKKLRRYPTGAETGCCKEFIFISCFHQILTLFFHYLAVPVDLSHLENFR
jgi:hypothetical protein